MQEQHPHAHYGINIMRERARQIGGDVQFETGAEHGTRVSLRFPVTSAQPEPGR
jgi:nitrate/nitrite-specific signal transduction histidine kinase